MVSSISAQQATKFMTSFPTAYALDVSSLLKPEAEDNSVLIKSNNIAVYWKADERTGRPVFTKYKEAMSIIHNAKKKKKIFK